MGPCGGRIRRVLGRLEHLAAAEAGSFSLEASAWGKLGGAPVGAGRQSLVRLPFDVAHVSSIRRSWAVTCSPWERASGQQTTLSLEHSAKDAMNFSLQTRDPRIVTNLHVPSAGPRACWRPLSEHVLIDSCACPHNLSPPTLHLG
jgi:hypothetical protein